MSKSIFSTIPVKRPRRSVFKLDHERKFSCPLGRLVPIMCEEVVPGDKFSVSSNFVIRFAPMVAPLMHNIDVFVHYFYVPNRIVWDSWEEFITGGPLGNSSVSIPQITFNSPSDIDDEQVASFNKGGHLLDYLGVSTQIGREQVRLSLSQLPIRAFHLCWLEYYRDENLEPIPDGSDVFDFIRKSTNTSLPFNRFFSSSQDPYDLYPSLGLRYANYIHDYFTSALPWTQRGPSSSIPISFGTAGNRLQIHFDPSVDTPALIRGVKSGTVPAKFPANLETLSPGTLYGHPQDGASALFQATVNNAPSLYTELPEESGSLSILDFRRANALQRWLEMNARGGSRLKETIFNHFGVRVPDARLQRPEFLGGGKVPVNISEVLQVSQTTSDSPQGNPSGTAVSAGTGVGFRNKFFSEHGFVFGIMSIMPRPAYQQGTRKFWRKFNKFDYYWPEFAHIGEQEIFNWEIFDTFSNVTDDDNLKPFGYTPRYAEYKFVPDSVHGDFKSSLSFWHGARIFSSRPALNKTFLSLGSDFQRIFAVQEAGSQQAWCWVYNKVTASRLMPRFGVPLI